MGLIMKNGIQYPGVGSGEGSGLEISQLDDVKITAPLKDGDELIYDKEKGKWINTTKYHKYSTDEQIIGEWIDGKPLYRKVITTQMPQVTTSNSPVTKSIEHNIVNAMFKKIELYCIDELGNCMAQSYTNIGDYFFAWIDSSTNLLYIRSNRQGFNNRTAVIILEYTKTTD